MDIRLKWLFTSSTTQINKIISIQLYRFMNNSMQVIIIIIIIIIILIIIIIIIIITTIIIITITTIIIITIIIIFCFKRQLFSLQVTTYHPHTISLETLLSLIIKITIIIT